MTFQVICAWCGQVLGVKGEDEPDTNGPTTTHSICSECKRTALSELNIKKKEGE